MGRLSEQVLGDEGRDSHAKIECCTRGLDKFDNPSHVGVRRRMQMLAWEGSCKDSGRCFVGCRGLNNGRGRNLAIYSEGRV